MVAPSIFPAAILTARLHLDLNSIWVQAGTLTAPEIPAARWMRALRAITKAEMFYDGVAMS